MTVRDELFGFTEPGTPFTIPDILDEHYADLSASDRASKKARFGNILNAMRKQGRAWVIEVVEVNSNCKVNVWVRE